MPVRRRDYARNGRKWTRFVATLETGGPGQRRRETKSFAKEREATSWLATQHANQQAGLVSGARAPAVAVLLADWLKRGSTRARKPWTPATRSDYELIVRTHLQAIARIRVTDLTVDHVEKLLGEIPGNRAVNVRSALSSALSAAVKQRLVPYNVAKAAELPGVERVAGHPLEPAEVARFLAEASHHRLYALFVVATMLGLRQSELAGLRWADVDLDSQVVHVVRKTYFRGGNYHTGDPKSVRSRRVVAFPAELAEVLREHRRDTLTEQLATREWVDRDLVFPNTHGGPLNGEYVTQAMQRIMVKAGVERRRFHDLRHTAASLRLALGTDMRTIQEVLGHSDYQLTANTYTHPDSALVRSDADRMGAFLRAL